MSQTEPQRVGILLAGGTGSRLYPLTTTINKQLLAVYDKPMVYYPLATLMLTGITEIVLISAPDSIDQFESCLGDGSQWGLKISYRTQDKPEGIPQAFTIAEDIIAGRPSTLILGDNILYGSGLPHRLQDVAKKTSGATIFGYSVSDPSRYGVVTLSNDRKPIKLEEKPKQWDSNLAVPGLYFYGPDVIELAKTLKPSQRGELEITDLNRLYLERGDLSVELMGRGWVWLDGGTHESLYDSTQFVRVIEERSGLKIACLEEIAYTMGYISLETLEEQVAHMPNSSYGDYLRSFIKDEKKRDHTNDEIKRLPKGGYWSR